MTRVEEAGRACIRHTLKSVERVGRRELARQFPMARAIRDTALLIGDADKEYHEALGDATDSVKRKTISALVRILRSSVHREIWWPRTRRTRAELKHEGIAWSRTKGWHRTDSEEADTPPDEPARPEQQLTRTNAAIPYSRINSASFSNYAYAQFGPWLA